jgi:VanW like protein
MPTHRPSDNQLNLYGMALFFLRSRVLQAKRVIENIASRTPPLQEGAATDFPFILSESVSPLHTVSDPREEPLEIGKIENLRLACRRIHQRVLLPGQIFSFWRQVGPPWRLRGFVEGREVREGCVIPTPGGGLCQLSGSLLEVSSALGFQLVERHRHTALPADVSRETRRDATVFWNYADLRFRTQIPVLIEAYLTLDSLVVRLRGKSPRTLHLLFPLDQLDQIDQIAPSQQPIQSCHVCNQTSCIHHRGEL